MFFTIFYYFETFFSVNPDHRQSFIKITLILSVPIMSKFYFIFVVHVACRIPLQLMVIKGGKLYAHTIFINIKIIFYKYTH